MPGMASPAMPVFPGPMAVALIAEQVIAGDHPLS
jgi:hypothetical protein